MIKEQLIPGAVHALWFFPEERDLPQFFHDMDRDWLDFDYEFEEQTRQWLLIPTLNYLFTSALTSH